MDTNTTQLQNIQSTENELFTIPEAFADQAHMYMELMMMYRGAIREVQTKLEVLNDEFSIRYQRNPISFIKSRIKSPESILKKLRPFIDDIYEVAQMLTRQDDVTLIETKDYIQNPKENGYRSLHLILEIPVFFSDRKQPMKVEVQIRTIAMDFWASLDHQLRYKKDVEHAEQISADLKDCADIISATDQRMQIIKYQIYGDESGNFLN